jgi:signal transduction histidine kinase
VLFHPRSGLVLPLSHTPERTELEPLLHRGTGWVWSDPNETQQHVLITTTITKKISTANPAPEASTPLASVSNPSKSITLVSSTPAVPANNPDGGLNSTGVSLGDGASLHIAPAEADQTSDGRNLQLPESLQGSQTMTMTVMKINGSSTDIILTPVEGNTVLTGLTPAQAQLVYTQQTVEGVTTIGYGDLDKPGQDWVLIGNNDTDQRWLGWMRANTGGLIRAVVLGWAELANDMAKSFPERLDDPADSFVLFNPAGDAVVWRGPNVKSIPTGNNLTTGDDPRTHPEFHVLKTLPLAAAEMPGWKLAVYFNPSATFTSGYLAVSTVLVSILVLSVLVGGTLLMREARREASEAARKTSFVSNVSHELKTPLTTIRMYAELLGDGRVRDQLKQNSYLTTIIAESQRLTRLVNNVLDFSRLEQGHKQYHPTDIALSPIIDNVIDSQKPRLNEVGFTIGSSFPAGPEVRVHVDRDALEQVILNLIDNAMKYSAPGRWIGIHVSTDAQFAYVAVSDSGPGVPLAHRERIFETFHRVDDSITASQPGAGLGLSIARRLLRDQEGDLTYQDHEPRGASFIAKLPLAAAISAAKIA